MDTQTKTPVEVVQELIAIHATRKEAAEKLASPAGDQGRQTGPAAEQSDRFIEALMNELSDYGDGVQSVAERENEYQLTYKKILAGIDTMTPQQHQQAFQELEESLKKVYRDFLEKDELPGSLQKIIAEQKEKL